MDESAYDKAMDVYANWREIDSKFDTLIQRGSDDFIKRIVTIRKSLRKECIKEMSIYGKKLYADSHGMKIWGGLK